VFKVVDTSFKQAILPVYAGGTMSNHDGVVEWCESLGVTCENPYDEFIWNWGDCEDEFEPEYWGI
jgi:hypothetical protein